VSVLVLDQGKTSLCRRGKRWNRVSFPKSQTGIVGKTENSRGVEGWGEGGVMGKGSNRAARRKNLRI